MWSCVRDKYVYIYMCVHVCVSVCVGVFGRLSVAANFRRMQPTSVPHPLRLLTMWVIRVYHQQAAASGVLANLKPGSQPPSSVATFLYGPTPFCLFFIYIYVYIYSFLFLFCTLIALYGANIKTTFLHIGGACRLPFCCCRFIARIWIFNRRQDVERATMLFRLQIGRGRAKKKKRTAEKIM